jgi:hypothetical protein
MLTFFNRSAVFCCIALLLSSSHALLASPKAAKASVSQSSFLEAYREAYKRGNPEEAFQLALAAARAGLPSAQSRAATHYFLGKGTPVSVEKGMFWANRAAMNKDPYGYNLMAMAYLQGEWAQPDIQKAYDFALLAKSAGFFKEDDKKEGYLFDAIKASAGEDPYNCMSFGFRQATPSFSQCVMQIAQSRRQEELAKQQYQLQVQQYKQQVAAEARRQRERQQALELVEREERERAQQELSDKLMALSADLLCPKTGPGMFAEPVAGCGRNKDKAPTPHINVIVNPQPRYCGQTAAGPIKCR